MYVNKEFARNSAEGNGESLLGSPQRRSRQNLPVRVERFKLQMNPCQTAGT